MCVSMWAKEWAYEIPKSAAFDAENIDHSIMKNNRYYYMFLCVSEWMCVYGNKIMKLKNQTKRKREWKRQRGAGRGKHRKNECERVAKSED